MKKTPLILLYFMAVLFGGVKCTFAFSDDAGIGAEIGLNSAISGVDEDAHGILGSALFLYDYSHWQLGVGAKYRIVNDRDADLISDLQLRYRVYQGSNWDFNLGVGFESHDPKLLYTLSYEISPSITFQTGLQSVFQDDGNSLQALIALDYFFTKPSSKDVAPHSVNGEEEPVENELVSIIQFTPDVAKREVEKKAPKFQYYTIKKGDWLLKIARALNMSMDALLALNPEFVNKQRRDLIYPGEVVRVR